MSKTCVITGASRGIGRAIAISLSNREDITNFILISRSKEGLQETVSQMNSRKIIECHDIDLTNYEKVEQLITSVGKRFGSIDFLLNVAGFANPKSLLETSIDDWEVTYKINVHSIFYITKEVVKLMKKTGGKILNVASTAGMTARPGWLAYASSKAAIISMSETLSEELSEYGILVYCISPGRCATELRKILAPDEDPSTIMQPEHVGEIVDHLLSDTGICLDGQNIIVRKQVQKQMNQMVNEKVLSEQTS